MTTWSASSLSGRTLSVAEEFKTLDFGALKKDIGR
jgi:hypothetical protein